MNATDLMVGDLVLLFGETPARVDAIGDIEVYVYEEKRGEDWQVGYEHIEPIPITPEILEKNGFVPDNFSPYYLPIEDGSIRFSEHQYGLYCNILRSYQRYDGVCNYVHQFQHALRLAGIDKEITI